MQYVRKRIVGATIASALLAGLCHAETISYADAVTKLAADCGADIRKLCNGLNLGSNRIADCLQQNSAHVSRICLSSLAAVSASIQQREQAQRAYTQVCSHDIAQRCSGVKGDGHILTGLVKAQRRVGAQCNQAITDAGWR
jgi:hypothetical protein